ncbi:PREDICTED: zinc finger E-box-binding homeobox 1-like [Polistes dominula]|uniref:Zinc finger E-box-binding homeobox 1-like n=1 Tax=Polistes dominula TaxID=743375 RepID=A0ABM1IEH6_POLDO|nr:PREDICTED: zinc finger E-box-binding homeobox 1-like [Polistes dominula]
MKYLQYIFSHILEDGWNHIVTKDYHHHGYYRLSDEDTNAKNHPTNELLDEYDPIQDNNDNVNDGVDDNNDNNPINNRYVCDFCCKRYSLNGLKKHMQTGCKKNPKNNSACYNCKYCGYTSVYKANMERHVRNIHDLVNDRVRCELCNFSSNYTFCVRRHMKTFHRK